MRITKIQTELEPVVSDGEEVDRNHLRHVICQKRPPRLRRRFGCRTMYLVTEDSETSIPSLRSSLWILGAPHRTLSRLMVRISSRVSFETLGRPAFPWRTFQVQYQRKPRRCQSITVSGLTITSADRHRDQNRDRTNPKTSIRWFQFRLGSLALKHNDLVPKSKDFGLQIRPISEIHAK